jgi:hypothetical protein
MPFPADLMSGVHAELLPPGPAWLALHEEAWAGPAVCVEALGKGQDDGPSITAALARAVALNSPLRLFVGPFITVS